ncbi:hypothetical protein F4553_005332 [Allocatelliglobosispora scoriae]|uniref:Uncharacterized protein n=1 Tax=Allocatelliglobosispora scoriae TaxID=643052 RepID=A0A841BYF2_9ACTN|nr:hypothetical protein [Allocatelliglobosispora scoriae]MBB5871953.1 hypothetical protein [Allocatelliglobosispora scoriae]
MAGAVHDDLDPGFAPVCARCATFEEQEAGLARVSPQIVEDGDGVAGSRPVTLCAFLEPVKLVDHSERHEDADVSPIVVEQLVEVDFA